MNSQNTTAFPAKKAWCKPEIILISENTINGGLHTSAHEANFTPIPGHPGEFHYNGGGTTFPQGVFDFYVS